MPRSTEKITHAYKSKHNLKHKNQFILLMITDGKKRHYLAVEKLSPLLRGITSNHIGYFYCLNCLHSYRTETGYSMVTHCSFDAKKNMQQT